MNLIEKALRVATVAHTDQVRKSDGSPYIVHPVMVGMMLKEYGFPDAAVAAGICHDVLEDTTVPRDVLVKELGEDVVRMIDGVSEDKALPWEERKVAYVNAVAVADEGTKAVSIADKIHNAESIIADFEHKGPAVWDVFNRGKEKKLWFESLVYAEVAKSWSHPLLDRYKRAIEHLETLSD